MKRLRPIVFGIFLAASPLLARDKVDTLVMNNGDRFTCEIKGLDRGVLYIGLDYGQGTIQIDWSKVRHVESKQLFLVKAQDGNNYVGALAMDNADAERSLRIIPVDGGGNAVLKPREVVGIEQTSESFWKRFSGAINSGFTFSKANETTQYTLGADADYLRKRWSSGAHFVSTLTSSTGVPTSTRNNVMAYYRHLTRWNNWFYTGTGSLLQSTEQNVQLQSNFGAGVGRYVRNTYRAKVDVFGGLAYQNTQYTDAGDRPPKQNISAAMVGVDAALFKFDKTKLTVEAVAFPALNQAGRVFSNVNTGYYIKLWSHVTWNLSFYGNWDTQPPSKLSGSDFGISSGFGWTFGNYNSVNK